LDKLRERRYLDDSEAARQFVEGKLRKGGFGRNLLRAELSARGVDDGVIEEVLGELTAGDDLDEAREEAERWAGRRSKPPEPAAMARRLERRGFSARAISTVVREMGERVALD
jgi:SOS response regulatory protein OraA/RecX